LNSGEGDYVLEHGYFGSIRAKESAFFLLKQMGLSEGEDTSRLIEKVLTSILRDSSCRDEILIRLAHICARLDCRAPKNFIYITQSGDKRHIGKGVCIDKDGSLRELLSQAFYNKHFLSDSYGINNESCSREEWEKWRSLPKAGLKLIPPLQRKEKYFRDASHLLDYISEHYNETLDPSLFPFNWSRRYSSQTYTLADHDFPSELIIFWIDNNCYESALAGLVKLMLASSLTDWIAESLLGIYQTSTNGSREKLVKDHNIPSSWLTRIRQVPPVSAKKSARSDPSTWGPNRRLCNRLMTPLCGKPSASG
jgi:hypothetical protein